MPKHDFLTPKAIANRIKSKGLQKLRWYCQMCQKQCRDENGFKCHTMSESHQRQMMLVADNPNKYLDYFSEEFLTDFLELLRRRFGTKRVHNNHVYNEYVQFKEHIHMNSTKWVTLGEFTKWLGREGYCVVEETPKGWFISYIDRDAEAIKKQEALKAKEKMDYTDEERNRQFIERQMALDSSASANSTSASSKSEPSELVRENEEEKIVLNLNVSTLSSTKKSEEASLEKKTLNTSNPLKLEASKLGSSKAVKSKPKSALQEIMEEGIKKKKAKLEAEAREQQKMMSHKPPQDDEDDDDKWLCEGLIVKIVTKRLGDRFYKQKARVSQLISDYVAIVELINDESKVKLDVMHVETVIPVPGKQVQFVKGKYRGKRGVLKEIIESKFCAIVELDGKEIKVEYESICKFES